MPRTDNTTIEQMVSESPEIQDRSEEAMDRAPGRGELQVSFALFLRFFAWAAPKAILGALRASGIFATTTVDSSFCVGLYPLAAIGIPFTARRD